MAAHGVGVINYYALASDFLSGKYRAKEDAGKSARGATVIERYLNARGMQILQALDAISEAYRVTPAQIALAWQMKHPTMYRTDCQRNVAGAARGTGGGDPVNPQRRGLSHPG